MAGIEYKGSLEKTVILIGLCLCLCGCGQEAKLSNVETGMEAIAALDYRAAMQNFEAAREAGENLRLVARGMGIASIGLTDYASAIEYLEECLSYSNGMIGDMDFDVNYYLALAHCKSGNYETAEQIYNAILALRQGEMDALFLRGNARLELGRWEEAIRDFEQVIKTSPNDYGRLIEIYEVMAEHDLKEQGKGYLETALSERGNKMSAYEKGRISYYLEDYNQACVYLEQAKKLNTAEVFFYLGKAYEATGDYNYAITNVYKKYLDSHAGDARLYNQLGLCYLQQKQYELALESFQSAMQIPDNGMMQTLQFNEIVAYEYLGEYASAAALMNQYLSRYPDDVAAAREYGFLSSR
ncbi:MAG: tetratricopeptide repeat protein [Lachnospiraceae bacterium]|nr:tetratricopeptide repeat protein [Lachnospiraceae bacterium]